MNLSADPGVDVKEIFKGCRGYKRCWASIGHCPLVEFGNTLHSLSAMIHSKKQRVKVAFAEKDLIKKIEVEWTALLENTMKNIINRHQQFRKYHECIPYLEKAIGKWYNREDVILRTLFEVHIHSVMKEETKRRWTHSRGQGQGLPISRDRWRPQTESHSQRGTHSQGRSPSRETRRQESQYTSQRGTHSQGRSPSRETRRQESQYTSQSRWNHSRGQGQGLPISRDRWRPQTQSHSQRGTHSQGRSPSRETRRQESQYTSQAWQTKKRSRSSKTTRAKISYAGVLH